MSRTQPIRILIAALGGEGGGVLAGWITQAAVSSGHIGQRTSIPGVAQRTGATTYYLEILPRSEDANGRRPVLALNPAPGEVDVLIASELLEAIRAVQSGHVSPDRTVLIASTSRVYTVDEKSAMGDGRLDVERMREVALYYARQATVTDFAEIARRAGSALNAVLLGALAACSALPIPAEAFRDAIRSEGKSVDANLRGFEAGLAAATGDPGTLPVEGAASAPTKALDVEERARTEVPAVAAEIAAEGVRRLADYQDAAYAGLYLDRIARLQAHPKADGPFIRELARYLAVRMSFEDTIRVAQLKLRGDRVERLRAEARAGDGDLIEVREFLKPGPEEIFSLLPPLLGRGVLRFVHWIGAGGASWPMRVNTTRFGGFIRLRLLAALRRWRRGTLRYAQEQAWIERWLSLIERALGVDVALAREVVETARLVKGYGDTYKRGHANWSRIVDEVVEPALASGMPAGQLADAVLQTRLAALADPEGVRLGAVIEAVRNLPAERRIAAE